MANIMVNEVCNLRCPYCFAEEFVNKSPKEMSLNDFRTALDFALSDPSNRQVGIIGGEPLLYSHINEALRMAVSDVRADLVMIYTNAVELERLDPEILSSSKFRMLVNCNSPEDMSEKAFDKMVENIFKFANMNTGNWKFRLSVNLYKPDFDYSYVIPIVKAIGFDVIRLSISVPQKGDLKGKTPLEYFNDMKLVSMRFVADMVKCGTLTGFDCNFLPECVLTEPEYDSMMAVKDVFMDAMHERYSESFWDRVIVCDTHNCTPVIDILPDLQAIRCFGMSEFTKRDIRGFRNILELNEYYLNLVDRPATTISTCEDCDNCYRRVSGICSCGCLVYKAKQIFKQ